jgi:hypothetical protein
VTGDAATVLLIAVMSRHPTRLSLKPRNTAYHEHWQFDESVAAGAANRLSADWR